MKKGRFTRPDSADQGNGPARLDIHRDIFKSLVSLVRKGEGKMVIDGQESSIVDGTSVVVPEGASHNVINTSDTEDLKLYALYSPPQHKDGQVNKKKPESKNEVE